VLRERIRQGFAAHKGKSRPSLFLRMEGLRSAPETTERTGSEDFVGKKPKRRRSPGESPPPQSPLVPGLSPSPVRQNSARTRPAVGKNGDRSLPPIPHSEGFPDGPILSPLIVFPELSFSLPRKALSAIWMDFFQRCGILPQGPLILAVEN